MEMIKFIAEILKDGEEISSDKVGFKNYYLGEFSSKWYIISFYEYRIFTEAG